MKWRQKIQYSSVLYLNNTMIEQVPTQEYEILSPPTDGISTVKFAPNENLLLASSWDTSVRLYDPIRNEPRAKYNHKASVLACCFSDSAHAFSGGIDRTFKMYEINVGTETTLGEHDMTISSLAYSPSSNLLVTGSWDKTVRLWDTRTRDKCIASLTQPERVYTMDVSGNRIIVGTAKRNVWIWDIRNHSEPEQQRESSLKYQTRCIRAFIDGTGYSLSSVEGRVAIEYFDPSPEIQDNKYAFKCHRTNVNGIDQVYPVNCMAYHGIYGTFATGGCDGMVNIWDGANKKRLCQFHRYPTSISSMDFNHDGTLLAIASSYTYEEGEKDHPPDAIFVRYVHELEVRPKPRV